MFCEKCGNQINPDDNFCEKCGNPIKKNNQPIQNFNTFQNGLQQNSQQIFQQNYPQNFQPTNEPPKKKKSSKVLKVFLISIVSLIVVSVALFTIFTFLVPNLKKVDISDYIVAKIEDGTYVDGKLSVKVSMDTEKLYQDYSNEDKNLFGSENFFNSLFNEFNKKYMVTQDLTEACEIEINVKDKDDFDIYEDGYYNEYIISNLEQNDVIEVTILWKDNDEVKNTVKQYKEVIGKSVDTESKTIEFSMSELIEQKGITLKTATEVDILKYIEDNNLFYTIGLVDGEMEFAVSDFEYKVDDYNFICSSKPGYSNSSISVKNSDGENCGSIQIYADTTNKLKSGDVIEIELNDDSLIDTSIMVSNKKTKYTVEKQKGITSKEIEKYINDIEDKLSYEIENHSWSLGTFENPEISKLYLFENQKGENILTVVLSGTNDKSQESKNVYKSYSLTNVYINKNKVFFSDFIQETNLCSTEDVVLKAIPYFDDKNYTSNLVLDKSGNTSTTTNPADTTNPTATNPTDTKPTATNSTETATTPTENNHNTTETHH